MRFLHQWVRHDTDLQGVKPSKQDRVTALQLLRELREEAERVKCDCCNGTGFKKKVRGTEAKVTRLKVVAYSESRCWDSE